MELVLNTTWMLLSAASVGLLLRYGRARQTSVLRAALLLACTLVLLFPMISASDDLRATEITVAEDSSFKRAKAATAELSSDCVHLWAAITSLLPNPQWHEAGHVLAYSPRPILTSFASDLQGRSPPTL